MEAATRSSTIYCVARNFTDHCKELGNPLPTAPIFFLKTPSAKLFPPHPIKIRNDIGSIHYETELVVVIGSQMKNVSVTEALKHVKGFGVALDLTARDVQKEAKAKGLPWTFAKSQRGFCPLCPQLIPPEDIDISNTEIFMKQNGKERQRGSTALMIFGIPQLLSFLSSFTVLEDGDVVLTGTPAGVGPLALGDVVEFGVVGKSGRVYSTEFRVEEEAKPPEGVWDFQDKSTHK